MSTIVQLVHISLDAFLYAKKTKWRKYDTTQNYMYDIKTVLLIKLDISSSIKLWFRPLCFDTIFILGHISFHPLFGHVRRTCPSKQRWRGQGWLGCNVGGSSCLVKPPQSDFQNSFVFIIHSVNCTKWRPSTTKETLESWTIMPNVAIWSES